VKVHIAGIGTALPPFMVDQPTVRSIVEAVFPNLPPSLYRVLSTFSHEHIATRHFVRPADWYGQSHGFGETNDVFIAEAVDLATRAAIAALSDAGLHASDVDAIVVASTTGLATPSLDAAVAQRLGCKPTVTRMPIVGLGCAAGVSGLSRSADLCKAGHGFVLFVAVEICSVTMQRTDLSKSNLVGTSLFGDGAGAVVIGPSGRHGAIDHSYSHLFPQTEDIMGWDVIDTGLKVRFSRDIPAFVTMSVAPVIDLALQSWGITRTDIDRVIPHPGGAKVLDAYANILQRPESDMQIAKEVLRNCGNMSSATVLFVLEQTLQQCATLTGRSLMTALGPGFSAEFLLLSHAEHTDHQS
jgi:alkylresorcinol/alkylpyrone synthase